MEGRKIPAEDVFQCHTNDDDDDDDEGDERTKEWTGQ